MNQKPFRKLLSIMLTLCLVLGMIPMTAFAEGDIPLGDSSGMATPSNATPTDIVVAAFDELSEDVLYQGYDLGEITSEDEINLPDILTGTDENESPITIEGITWQSKSAFDLETPGIYEFSPVLPSGYVLSEGTKASVITAVIRPEGGMQIQPMAMDEGTLELGDKFYLVTTGADGNGGWGAYTHGTTKLLWDDYNTLTAPYSFSGFYPADIDMNNMQNGRFDVAGEANPDLLLAKAVAANTGDAVTLRFQHAMHQFIVGITKDNSAVSGSLLDVQIHPQAALLGGAEVDYTTGEVTGAYDSGSTYPMNNVAGSYIVAPQDLTAGDVILKIALDSQEWDVKVPIGGLSLESGKSTEIEVELKAAGEAEVAVNSTNGSWYALSGNTVVDVPLQFEAASTGTVTGSMYIAGITVSDLRQDDSGTGWSWNAADATLTLTDDITGGIVFASGSGDVTVKVENTVTVSGMIWQSLTDGKLTITGGGALTVTHGYDNQPAISSESDMAITGGTTVNATTTGDYSNAIVVFSGDFTMSDGKLNLSTTGDYSSGIYCQSGDISISGTAEVKTSPTVKGFGLYANDISIGGNTVVNVQSTDDAAIFAEGEVAISGGTVTAKGTGSIGAITGVTNSISVTGGTLTLGGVGENNGNVRGNLTVSGASAQVTVNGNIANGGNLTVSNGTVTVTGTVQGNTTVTGGTVNVNGQNIPPSGGPTGPETITYPGTTLQDDPLYGSTYQSLLPTASVSNNTVTVNSGTISGAVYGGFDHISHNGSGGNADVTDNTVTMNGGEISGAVNAAISGGRAYNGAASGNTVTINGGTITGFYPLRGGESMIGDAKNNHIIITGGTIKAQIVGGLSGMGTTDNNSISIREGSALNLSESTLLGHGSRSTLNVERAGITIDSIVSNFEHCNFKLPATTTNGSVMITSTNSSNIQGTAIAITFAGAPSFNVGDKITLISKVTGTPTASTASALGYTFGIAVESDKLIATVTGVPSGGGVTTYPINVTNGTASPTSAAQGAIVTLTANPAPSGQRFKEWSISPSVTFTSGTSKNSQIAKFTMPAGVVTATANYEAIPTGITAVTSVSLNRTSLSLYSNTSPKTAQLAATVSPSNATDNSVIWASGNTAVATVDQNGNVTAISNGTAVITVTTTDGGFTASCTVTVSTYQGGGGGGNGSSSSGDTTTGKTTVTSDTDMPVTATIEATGTADKNGNLSLAVTDAMVRNAIEKAQAEAERLGKTGDGIVVEIKSTTTGGKSMTATIEAAALSRLNTAGAGLSITSPVSRFALDAKAVKEAATQSTGTVVFTATPVTKLSDAAKALIGSRPVFDLTVSYQKDGKTQYVSSFGKGTVTLGIPYTPAAGEKTGSLFIVYVDANGKPQLLTNSSYDNGWMIWSRNSLSTYGVGYKTPAPAFTDTATHWAKDNIDFVVSRGLVSGTTATTFAPNTAITRADFLMALGKLSGADVSGYKTSSFTDVKATDAAMPYIEWAVANKIVQGIGNNQFGPTQQITREQMAVMMVNYAKVAGYTLPAARQHNAFADNANISTWAEAAVKAVQQAGIIVGKDGNKFDPQGNATRAEAATILRRYVELVIDEGTARGWVKNDSGQWQYYNWQGKRTTGWLSITGTDTKYYFDANGIMVSGKWVEIGGKWYYFYTDGKLARSTTVEGYKVDDDGVRQGK